MKLTLDIVSRCAFRFYGYLVAYNLFENGLRYDAWHCFIDDVVIELDTQHRLDSLYIRHAEIPEPFIEYLKTKILPELLPDLLRKTAKHSAGLDYATEVQRYLEAQRLQYLHTDIKEMKGTNIIVDIKDAPLLPDFNYTADARIYMNSMRLDICRDGELVFSLTTHPLNDEWSTQGTYKDEYSKDLDSILAYLDSNRDTFFATLSSIVEEADINKIISERMAHGL